MRIGSQNDVAIQAAKMPTPKVNTQKVDVPKATVERRVVQPTQTPSTNAISEEQKDVVSKEKLEEAVSSINEFLHTQQKASKFVFHEGLDKYYVKLVDPETDELIKEIPPEKLLNAFYEMKKLAGMIVDEKI